MFKRSLLATAAALLAATPALAQVAATAATDLNLRAGPGGDQEILAVIPAEGAVTVDGCLEAANWCQVTYEGTQGWAYGEYLNATGADQQQVVVIENREPLQVATITTDTESAVEEGAETAIAGTTGAAFAAALIGGPAAIAAGAVLGAAAGSIADDDPAVVYVRENPADPIYLDGEVVLGAGIPEGVEIREIPDSDYSYANINGVPVLVNNDRSIVRIVRD